MSDVIEQQANKKNLLQLVYLRAIAICGQFITIFVVHHGMGIPLPMDKMLLVIAFLLGLNIVGWQRYKRQKNITATELFIELLLDVAALTTQLYLSGGASNPFVSLFLLQVIIGAILLKPVYAWALFLVTFVCYLTLTFHAQDLQHMYHYHLGEFFNLHVHGMLISYTIGGVLLVFFLTRINANIKERDLRLADIKQQSLEEDHILRMGLLAAGAAHELGTPLTTISVILKDWQSLSVPESKEAQQQDIDAMQRQIQRCKDIVSNILLSSGHVRGESSKAIMLDEFINMTVAEWKETRRPAMVDYQSDLQPIRIISDQVIKQMLLNVFDNALEASPKWVGIAASVQEDRLEVRVSDNGKGFSAEALESFGKPYTSSKDGHGRGLGLFLVVNTLRKLGGQAQVENLSNGAMVCLSIPLSSIHAEGA